MMNKLHVINSKNERKTISWSELRKINEGNNNGDKFFHDIEWYLNNGYIPASELTKRLRDAINNGTH